MFAMTVFFTILLVLAMLGTLTVLGFGVATILFGLSRNPAFSFLMLMLTGALDNISVVVRGTLVQTLTPDAMRGRVSAVNGLFIGSSNELGGFESGVTAQWFVCAAVSPWSFKSILACHLLPRRIRRREGPAQIGRLRPLYWLHQFTRRKGRDVLCRAAIRLRTG